MLCIFFFYYFSSNILQYSFSDLLFHPLKCCATLTFSCKMGVFSADLDSLHSHWSQKCSKAEATLAVVVFVLRVKTSPLVCSCSTADLLQTSYPDRSTETADGPQTASGPAASPQTLQVRRRYTRVNLSVWLVQLNTASFFNQNKTLIITNFGEVFI